ncbi:rRNA pseudouridine synthase [Candidatus Woesearchaeota archaeon]|nr:rRNA pseudouridine synthase [Candidatus Woesearchaeota archaeon]
MKAGKFEKVYECIQAIRNGKISINNKIIINPNYFFNPKNVLIKFNNEKIKTVGKLYFLLNKPAGYLSQKSESEKTIYDLSKKLNIDKNSKASLFAVGRLDKDTEGLMIITNDGKLSNLISNPRNEIKKEYYATLENPVDKNKINILEKGIELEVAYEKYKTKPCKIKIAGEKEIYISISEGKKRQIRKMFDAICNKVVYLKRVSIGGIQLGNLKAGEIKDISRDEVYKNIIKN